MSSSANASSGPEGMGSQTNSQEASRSQVQGTPVLDREAIRRTDDPALLDELLEMLAKGPEGPPKCSTGRPGETPGKPSLPEISSSPFEMNYRWPSASSSSKSDKETSISSKQSSQSAGSQDTKPDSGKRAVVKNMLKNMGQTFSIGSSDNPAGPKSMSKQEREAMATDVPVYRRSFALERSQRQPNIENTPEQTEHADRLSHRKSTYYILPELSQETPLPESYHPPLQEKASTATVSSITETETMDSGHDDDFVAQLMAGASWSIPTYAHDLKRRSRPNRHRADSQATSTTESLTDKEDLSDEEFDGLSVEVASLEASHIGLNASHSAPNLQKSGSSSSLASSSMASSSNARTDSRSHAARIRQQIAYLNLARESPRTPDTPTQPASGQHPASSPATQTHFANAKKSPSEGQTGITPEASALRGRSQSESVLTSQDAEASAAMHGRSNAATLIPGVDAAQRPSLGGRTRSGSLLKAAVAGATEVSKAEITLAVIGDKDAGKSTLIHSVLKKQVGSGSGSILFQQGLNAITAYDTTLTVYGKTRTVQILEVDSPVLTYDHSGVTWPAYLPRLDGALLCYDATNPKALQGLKQMLGGFWTRGGLKLIVVACKSNPKPQNNRVDPAQAVNICQAYSAGLVALDGGIEDSQQKQKNSIKWVCRTVVEGRGEELPPSDQRLRKMRSKHQPQRGANDAQGPPTAPESPMPSSPLVPIHSGTMAPNQPRFQEAEELSPTTPASPSTTMLPSLNASQPYDKSASHSASGAPGSASDADPLKRPITELDLCFERDDLIDKLLYAAVSDNDESFVNYFLIIYRRFAKPHEVLCKLVERHDFVSARLESDPMLARYAHMKLAGLLDQWMRIAPNDFCGPLTYDLLKPFLTKLLNTPWTTQFGGDLLSICATIQPGVSTEGPWALPDVGEEERHTHNERKMSLVPPEGSPDMPHVPGRKFSSAPSLGSVGESALNSPNPPSTTSEGSERGTTATSPLAPPSSTTGNAGQTAHLLQTAGPPGSQHGRDALLLRMSDDLNEVPEYDLAQQITRVFWRIFKLITPRDLIRHVMAPRDLNSPTGGLLRDSRSPVGRSIALVNFLSNWVATLILVQPKAKRRATLFEKFIGVAAHLRDLENFDALMGVLAGLSSQPVARLIDTDFESVKEKPIFKKYRSLKKLMANLRGFSAYRMALASSGPQTLPYLGCHLQDITRFLESKSDMKDGLVNWTKFSQIARCAAIVLDCPRHAPELPIVRSIEALLSECPAYSLEDDELYDLSYTYRRRGGQTSTSSRTQSNTVKRVQRFLANHATTNSIMPQTAPAPFHTPAS